MNKWVLKAMALAVRFLLLFLAGLILLMAILYVRQDHYIYRPKTYWPDYETAIPPRSVQLKYKISCGQQSSWYVPPRSATDVKVMPKRLWIMFGGNGSLSLYWANIVKLQVDKDAGVLLFDYPGYGFCEGKPSPQSIAESGDALVAALAKYLDVPLEKLLDGDIRLMGHSLGSGTALEFAVRHPVNRIVLMAPFTSFRAMANTRVTPLLSWLMRDNMDNIAALGKIASRKPRPQIIVVHGDKDDIVPVSMGRAMERRYPDLVDYIEMPGGNHVDILDYAQYFMAPDLPRPLESLGEARVASGERLPDRTSPTSGGGDSSP